RLAEHRAVFEKLAESLPGGFCGPLHGRFAITQSGLLVQATLGNLAKALLEARQREHFLGGRRQTLAGKTQPLIPRKIAAMTVVAVVVAPLEADVPQEAAERFEPIVHEFRRFLAVRAEDTGAVVPPFFRSWRAVSRAWVPRAWTRSRTSYSVLPKSSASGLD